jgi:lysophospholipase L1-like esterase
MRGVVSFICAVLLLTACGRSEETSAPVPTPLTPASTVAPAPKIITVIGDSYTSGTDEGGVGGNGWPSLMSVRLRKEGIATAAKVAAEGGAGYVTPGYEGHTFGQLAARSVQPHDDLVIYFGSLNDGYDGGLDVQAATAAVNDTLAKTRATARTAKLLVIGPASPFADTPPPYAVALNDILRDQAALVGATFVDSLGEKWLQDDPALVGPDDIHPSNAGHRHLADKIEPLVAAQLG